MWPGVGVVLGTAMWLTAGAYGVPVWLAPRFVVVSIVMAQEPSRDQDGEPAGKPSGRPPTRPDFGTIASAEPNTVTNASWRWPWLVIGAMTQVGVTGWLLLGLLACGSVAGFLCVRSRRK
jgi:hypothetical protein